MDIKSINIKNFKSIKDITIPIQSYGEGNNKNNTTFLVGINESGKSAILEAIGLINTGLDSIDYKNYCHIGTQDNSYNYIDIYIEFGNIYNSIFELRKIIKEKLNLSDEFINKLEICKIIKNIYKNETRSSSAYEIKINNDLPLFYYIINKEQTATAVGTKPQVIETIKLLSEFNEIDEKITFENAKTFLKENQELLSKEKLEGKLENLLKTTLDMYIPEIQIWRPSPKYLINETIDLQKFKEDPEISIPLKNIFSINGKTTNEEIKNSIERALSDQARCDELKEKMEAGITKYINNIWKEHNIKIKISIIWIKL